jgi:bifunctional UDP-N-acetylglucosamine pyrophosphorylase / glucosamine-1-phosphate N-acetyltransferase
MKLQTVILAAGQGTRMRSALPKVLHRVGAKPLVEHVYGLARKVGSETIVIVYGHGGSLLPEACAAFTAEWVEQSPQLGTGHAVQQAAHLLADDSIVLILYGDVPLLTATTVDALLESASSRSVALLTVILGEPTGYGRIVRDATGKVCRIVEERDATSAERQITEVNTGILACPGRELKRWLASLNNANSQGEYYLTDVIGMAVTDGFEIAAVTAHDYQEVQGINTRQQLAEAERVYQRRQAEELMDRGASLLDPARFDLRGEITELGQDVEIDVNVVLEGAIRLGHRVRIGAGSVLKDCRLGDDVVVLPNCCIEQAEIGDHSRIGPFARIRPDTRLAEHVHIGNFVEVKKSEIASHSKVNHLSYIGDTTIGRDVNIGAGTITCNYDGANKHQTVIEDGVFVGSDTQLVAPVRVARNATIGAGSTITKDVPESSLALSRVKQVSLDGWQRPVKKGK